MMNFLLPAAMLGGSRHLRGTMAILAIVTLIATMFFYVVRVIAVATWWLLRSFFSGVRGFSRRHSANGYTP